MRKTLDKENRFGARNAGSRLAVDERAGNKIADTLGRRRSDAEAKNLQQSGWRLLKKSRWSAVEDGKKDHQQKQYGPGWLSHQADAARTAARCRPIALGETAGMVCAQTCAPWVIAANRTAMLSSRVAGPLASAVAGRYVPSRLLDAEKTSGIVWNQSFSEPARPDSNIVGASGFLSSKN